MVLKKSYNAAECCKLVRKLNNDNNNNNNNYNSNNKKSFINKFLNKLKFTIYDLLLLIIIHQISYYVFSKIFAIYRKFKVSQ